MNTLGDRLKARRQILGLTQEDLAKKAAISKGFLSEVENNSRNLSAENLLKLARELGVSLDYLMKGEGSADSPLREKLQIPDSLAKFAVEKNLQFDETITLLGMKKQVVARRRDEGDDDLESFDWRKFYESVKDYL